MSETNGGRSEQALRVELAADAVLGLHGLEATPAYEDGKTSVCISLRLTPGADEVTWARWEEAGFSRDKPLEYVVTERSFWSYAVHVASMAPVDEPQHPVAEHIIPAALPQDGDTLLNVVFELEHIEGCETTQTPIPCRGRQQVDDALSAASQMGATRTWVVPVQTQQ